MAYLVIATQTSVKINNWNGIIRNNVMFPDPLSDQITIKKPCMLAPMNPIQLLLVRTKSFWNDLLFISLVDPSQASKSPTVYCSEMKWNKPKTHLRSFASSSRFAAWPSGWETPGRHQMSWKEKRNWFWLWSSKLETEIWSGYPHC